jgi:hypothetical protein
MCENHKCVRSTLCKKNLNQKYLSKIIALFFGTGERQLSRNLQGMQRNNQFGVGAAKTMAPMLAAMVGGCILIS